MDNTWETNDSARTMTSKYNNLVADFNAYKERFEEHSSIIPPLVDDKLDLIAEQLMDQLNQNKEIVDSVKDHPYLNSIYADANELVIEYKKGV